MDTITVRTSERGTFKRCPKKWYWAYVEGLRPLRPANALWFGIAVHEAFATWYQEGSKREGNLADLFDAALEGDRSIITEIEDGEVLYEDARELGRAMLDNYVAHYGHDEEWDVIATEVTFQIKIKTAWGFTIRYVGTWDGVYRDRRTGEIWLMEHKTAAQIRIDHLPLDDQAGSYWALAGIILRQQGILKPGEEIAGIMYNIVKKDRRDDRPVNPATGLTTNKPLKKHYAETFAQHFGRSDYDGKPYEKFTIAELESIAKQQGIAVYGDPSKEQPGELLARIPVHRSAAERKTQIQRIKDEALYMYKIRQGDPDYPVYKSVNQFGPMACTNCEFFRLCQLDESGDDMAEDFKAAMFTTWNPYGDHQRKAA